MPESARTARISHAEQSDAIPRLRRRIGYDESADAFHSRVIRTRDVVDFYGRTPDELRTEFKASVDESLSWCREEGRQSEKFWLGKLTFRPTQEQRRRFVAAASARRMSVNAWALSVLAARVEP